MKTAFFSFCFMLLFANGDLPEIRKIYPTAIKSEGNAKELVLKTAQITLESEKTLVAYKGAAITLTAKFTKNLGKKMRTFKEGAKMIEFAVTKDPNNIEIHLVRLSVQENVPGITGYTKNIKEDAAFLTAHYKEQSGALKEYVKDFILQSKSFSDTEKQNLK